MDKHKFDIHVYQENLDKIEQVDAEITRTASINRLAYIDNAGKFTKVAFDVFENNANGEIWKLEEDKEGRQWLIRDEAWSNQVASNKNEWNARVNAERDTVTITYNDKSLMNFAGEDYNFDKETVESFRRFILKKVESNTFKDKLLNVLSPEKAEIVKGKSQ